MNFTSAPPLKPFENAGRQTAPAASTRLAPADLSGVIAQPKKDAAAAADPEAARHEQLVRQAGQWVAQTFFGVLLKQMRDSPFKSDLFEGGRGGQAFSSLYDQKLVEHMSRGASRNLVAAIVRKLEAGAAYRRQSREVTPVAGDGKADGRSGLGEPQAEPQQSAGRTGGRRPPEDGEEHPFQHVRTHVAPGL